MSSYDTPPPMNTPTAPYSSIDDQRETLGRMSTSSRPTLVFDIYAIPDEDELIEEATTVRPEAVQLVKKKKYKGRYRIWPGVLLLLLIATVSVTMISIYAKQARQAMLDRTKRIAPRRKRIEDGIDDGGDSDALFEDEDLDRPGNPSKYPDKKCAHVNYISKKGYIWAEAPNGRDIKLPIKGINWSGMETSHGIPYGLWDNLENGTTVFQVVAFLARNKFNSVRLPLSVENIIHNIKPNRGFINTHSNMAINVKNYRSLLKSIVAALAYRGISVLLDIHTLTPRDTGEFWYSDEVPETDVLKAIDILGEDLCNQKYWNIVGLDLKNEPSSASWGTNVVGRDWRLGAQKLGNRMLKACSKWTAHVEGISAPNTIVIDGRSFVYYDWWGGGLQKAKDQPIKLDVAEKVVYSPHYYSPAVYPAQYFFTAGRMQSGRLMNYQERTDKNLYDVVNVTMQDMFGHLCHSQDFAVVMGEFGGLYGNDKHPKKTTKRVIDYTINHLVHPRNKYGGGYVWSLNPESGYEYNPVDAIGKNNYGLLDDDWLRVNKEYLTALAEFDEMDGLKMFPCFREKE